MIKSMIIPEMDKVYYWVPSKHWCKIDTLQESIDNYGLDYHITHVYKSDTVDMISNLIRQLI